jgi:peroxiredoxin
MAAVTPVCDFGWKAADFNLEGVDGKRHTLAGIRGKNGALVMFICNHCPYVKAVVADLVADCKILQAEGIGVAAIMSNDTVAYPDDSFDNMRRFAAQHGFTFPYLIDPTQEVARAYDAACTPDFFGFDKDLRLQYRGRIYEMTGRQPKPGAPRELLAAMRQVALTGQGPRQQAPSMGCSIKWRAA